jgi:hypothetical protein
MPIATSPIASTAIGVDDAQTATTVINTAVAYPTLPTIVCTAYVAERAVVHATLPNLNCAAQGFPLIKATATIKLPTIIARSNAVGVGHADAVVKIPKLGVRAQTGGYVQAQLPFLVAKGVALSGIICGGQVFLPQITATVHTGAHGRAKLPKLIATSTTTSTCVIKAFVVLPKLVATGVATVTIPIAQNHVVCKAHLPNLVIKSHSGAKVSAGLLKLRVIASATSGVVASVRAALPHLRAVARCTPNTVIATRLFLPKLGVVPRAYARAKLPKLVTIATVVGARGLSETWVVNLKHDPHSPPTGEADVDEVTTYTNYDFEQIVRNGEDYYGVGSQGVFKLGKVVGDDSGGTAGGSTPVEFYFKTGLHDFRAQTQKTIVSAYIAGRINGGVIVDLFPGENAVQPQRFTTPRGNTVQNYRQKFPLGNKFRYYAFGIGGNTPFVLDGLGVELANMTRRV